MGNKHNVRSAVFWKSVKFSLAAFLFFILSGLMFFPSHAQIEPTIDSYSSDIWVGSKKRLTQYSAKDGSSTLVPIGIKKADSIVSDMQRGFVWVADSKSLKKLDFRGVTLAEFSFDDIERDIEDVRLALDANTGSVWMSSKKRLYHFTVNCLLEFSIKMDKKISALSADPINSAVWVGNEKKAILIDINGATTATIGLDKEYRDVEALYHDSSSGALWIAGKRAIGKFAPDGTLLNSIKIKEVEEIVGDGNGGVYLSSEEKLLRLSETATPIFEIEPLRGVVPPTAEKDDDHDSKIKSISFDPSNDTLWVAGKKVMVQVSGSGTVINSFLTSEKIRDIAVFADIAPPTVKIDLPLGGSATNNNRSGITVSHTDENSGVNPASISITVNGQKIAATCATTIDITECIPQLPLSEGVNEILVHLSDMAGNIAVSSPIIITVDTVIPTITVTSPAPGSIVNIASLPIVGNISEPASLLLSVTSAVGGAPTTANYPLTADALNNFTSAQIPLSEGLNSYSITASDAAGNIGTVSSTITIDTIPPLPLGDGLVDVSAPDLGMVTITGNPGAAEAGATIVITNVTSGLITVATALADGSFTAAISANANDLLTITVVDAAANQSQPTEFNVPSGAEIIPSVLDPTGVTDFSTAVDFLWNGPNAVQVGVQPGAIDPRRVTVVRGLVKTDDGLPLKGVTVTALNGDQFGSTTTRSDGMFDMALNGGGHITLNYSHPNFLPVQRRVDVPWRDYAWADDVVMISRDPKVTTVALGAATFQTAQGSVVSDARGTRQATIMVPPGLTASITLPDGSQQPLTSMNVRVTEYTAGPNGEARMPATLPPETKFTYAVELSVDEAAGIGANGADGEVVFNRPVYYYVDDFIGFTPGIIAPVGYYDNEAGKWIPSKNGLVIGVLGVTNGLADIDVSGQGLPATPAEYAQFGFTDAERAQIAALYPAGKVLWRAEMSHFSPWDINWGGGCGTIPCDYPPGQSPEDGQENSDPPNNCEEDGSIIGCQSQTLGERLPIIGTGQILNYTTAFQNGRKEAYSIEIPITGKDPVTNLLRVDLVVEIAGKKFTNSFASQTNQNYTFIWDGTDAYGRELQGVHTATIKVGYVYRFSYFGEAKHLANYNGKAFGYNGGGKGRITASAEKMEFIVWQVHKVKLGMVSAATSANNVGGWSIDKVHQFDPEYGYLYLGTGEKTKPDPSVNNVLKTVAGKYPKGTGLPEGTPGIAPTEMNLTEPKDISIGPDGSVYVVTHLGHRVWRVFPDGTMEVVAGTGTPGYNGDDIPANQAQLYNPVSVAVALDGTVYIADFHNWSIRKVDPNGIITTVAGIGGPCPGGCDPLTEGVDPTTIHMNVPTLVTVDKEDRLWFLTAAWEHPARLNEDGTITLATDIPRNAEHIEFGPDGSLYYILQGKVWKKDTSGELTHIAGAGCARWRWGVCLGEYLGDGGPAIDAYFRHPSDLAVSETGSVFVFDAGNHVIREVMPNGAIRTIAGKGCSAFDGVTCYGKYTPDGTPARQGYLSLDRYIAGMDFAPDGSLFFLEMGSFLIRKVSTTAPGFGPSTITVPSSDGGEVYVFNLNGVHLETVDSITGNRKWAFSYDANRLISGITDAYGALTQIQRDAAGRPTAIVSPDGLVTSITTDANGYIASVTDPAGNKTSMTYTQDGLMTAFIEPLGNTSIMSYSPLGRLTSDFNAEGGGWALSKVSTGINSKVVKTSAEGRVTTYETNTDPSGVKTRLNKGPDGLTVTSVKTSDLTQTTTSPDGTITTSLQGADPRFGMSSPYLSSLSVKTPGGLASNVSRNKSATLANPDDLLSLQTITDSITVNGKTHSSVYDKATLTLASHSAGGRSGLTRFDVKGNVIASETPGLYPANFAYDARGRLVSVTQGTAPVDRSISIAYDANGNLSQITDPLGGAESFQYDLAGRLTQRTLKDGRAIGFAYDANGNVTSITPPGRPSHSFAYNLVRGGSQN